MRSLADNNLEIRLALRRALSIIDENGVPLIDYSLFKSKEHYDSTWLSVFKMGVRRLHLFNKANQFAFDPMDMVQRLKMQEEESCKEEDWTPQDFAENSYKLLKKLVTDVKGVKDQQELNNA